MLKKLLGLLIGIIVLSFYNPVNAHGTFTWFGLRNSNTEVIFQSSSPHADCGHKDCHKPKPPKHKHKPKPKKPKHDKHIKGPNAHRWWWWDKD